MLYNYDKALEEKFKKVFERVVYAPVDKFYERYLLKNGNNPIQLPAMSLWRVNSEFFPYNATTQARIPNFRMGTQDPLLARQIYSMQTSLSYQLDLWTANDIDRDDLLKEVLYFLVMYPNIHVEYQGQKFVFPVQLGVPDDVTDISQFEDTGDIYRVSIPLTVPDARLMFYDDVKKLKYINLSYYVNGELDSQSIIGPKEGG